MSNKTYCKVGTNGSLQLLNDLTDPVREFWERKVLQQTSGIHDLGGFQTELLGYLILSYVLMYLCIFKGIRWTGKVVSKRKLSCYLNNLFMFQIVYVTATFPYIIIIIILIRGITLPGAIINGIKYYLLPDFQKFLDIQVRTEKSQIAYGKSKYLIRISEKGMDHSIFSSFLFFCCWFCNRDADGFLQ